MCPKKVGSCNFLRCVGVRCAGLMHLTFIFVSFFSCVHLSVETKANLGCQSSNVTHLVFETGFLPGQKSLPSRLVWLASDHQAAWLHI